MSTNTRELKSRIVTHFLNEPIQSRAVLRTKLLFWYERVQELDKVLTDFIECGMLRMTPDGNDVIYMMPQEQIDELKRLFQKSKPPMM